VAQHGLGKLDIAIADYGRALEKQVDESLRVPLWTNRAAALELSGNYRSAIADYDAIIESDPKNHAAYVKRSYARRRVGQAAGALADIEKAMEGRSDDIALLRERGHIHWNLDDHRAALRDFDRILEQRPDPMAYRSRGMIHFCLADWERAEADLNAARAGMNSRRSEYAELWRLLARRRANKDDEQAAVTATIGTWPKSWAKSIGEYLTGNLTQTRLLAEAGIGDAPPPNERRCEAYFYIGTTHLMAGHRTLAKHYFEKCVSTGAFTCYEYKLARAELSRLRKSE
jgi:lipoprotein NlpI